jgi:hypothetical protein
MNGTEAVVELLGGTRTVGASVRTLADLDAAVRAGLPRTSLDRVVEAAAPASERLWLRNRLVPRAIRSIVALCEGLSFWRRW